MNFSFNQFDGTNRKPREVQIQALKWLSDNWDKSNIFAMNLPTGVGKSAILRSIQLQCPGTVGIVPTNILLDQYQSTYSELNCLKGAEHYKCKDDDFTCKDRILLKLKHAEDCPYKSSKARAKKGEATIFNPISYFYFRNKPIPDVMVVDEAHKLGEMIMMLTSFSFRKGRYSYPLITTDIELNQWLNKTIASLSQLIDKTEEEKTKTRLVREKDRIEFLQQSFENNPQDFVFYTKTEPYHSTTDEYLHVSPIKPTKWLVKKLLDGKKLIFMSATLLKSDLWDLGYSEFQYLDVNSPIPVANRQIIYRPHTEPMNYTTPEASVAKYIEEILKEHPNQNTIVHLSYGWAKRLGKYFPNALVNTSDNKYEILQKFKKQGGTWLAAGCSEGIDLPGDECRLVIIPLLLRANITDPVIKKQMAQPRGNLQYDLNTAKTLIQQAGRGTRGIDDYSVTIVGDNSFPRLFNRNRQFIPISFQKAIVWRTK